MKKTKKLTEVTGERLKLFKTVARELSPKETSQAAGGIQIRCGNTWM